jgi:transposase
VSGRHQVVDLPPTSVVVTEYVMHSLTCSGCGSTTHADLPADAPRGVVGLRLQAAMAILTGRYRMSRREGAEALESLFGRKARISPGWLSALEGRTVEALAPAYAEAEKAVRSAPVVNADETPFRVRRRKAWLWVALSKVAALFRVDGERSARAFRRLLGAFKAVLCTDRFASYHSHAKRRRQICIAHLKRNFQELVDRGAPASEVGQAGLGAIESIFKVWNAYERGEIPFERVAPRLTIVRAALLDVLLEGTTNGDEKAAGMCRDLAKLFPCIWTFTRIAGVEPTNNAAERALRPAVLWRKGSFGCHSEMGGRYVESMLTVVHTLRIQGRSAIDFIERALRAALLHTRPPRLILGNDTG